MHHCLAFIYYYKRERTLSIKGVLSIGVLRDMGIIVKTGIIAVMLLACIGAVSLLNLYRMADLKIQKLC